MARLLEVAKQVTAKERNPVRDWGDVGARMEVSAQQLTNWKNRGAGISREGALKAEEVFGCSPYWLMTGAMPEMQRRAGAIAIPAFDSSDDLIQPSRLAPEIAWASLEGVILLTNEKPEVTGAAVSWEQVHTEAAGPRSKFVRMPDESLAGRVGVGALLLIDPDLPGAPGKIVLVRDKAGELYLRQYRALGVDTWEATSTQPNAYAPLPGRDLEVLGRAVQLVSLEP